MIFLSSVTFNVAANPETADDIVASELTLLARRIGCDVSANIRGVSMTAHPLDDEEAVLRRFKRDELYASAQDAG